MTAHESLGHQFNRLTVLTIEPPRHGCTRVLCRCVCGNERVYDFNNIRRGRTNSCGCHGRDERHARQTHGLFVNNRKQPSEYRIWANIKTRCYNTSHHTYANYGARGIAMCDRWRDDFQAFLADMGPRPSARHTIDRIDNDGQYAPENCRWADKYTQARNMRTNRWLTHNGVTMCLADWARQAGLDAHIVFKRLAKGWSLDQSLAIPIVRRRKGRRSRDHSGS